MRSPDNKADLEKATEEIKKESSLLVELVKMANHLDSKGLLKEASQLDTIMKSNIAEIKRFAGKEVPAWEAMSHEDHSAVEESPGFTEFEAEESYRKDLDKAAEVAELILRGTPIMGDDAEEMVRELSDILTKNEHLVTVEAIIEYLRNPEGSS